MPSYMGPTEGIIKAQILMSVGLPSIEKRAFHRPRYRGPREPRRVEETARARSSYRARMRLGIVIELEEKDLCVKCCGW